MSARSPGPLPAAFRRLTALLRPDRSAQIAFAVATLHAPDADPAQRDKALAVLLARAAAGRDHPAAHLALAAAAPRLTDAESALIHRAHPGLLEAATTAALSAQDPAAIHAGLWLVHDRALLGQSERLVDLLAHADAPLAHRAERTLAALIAAAITHAERDPDHRAPDAVARAALRAVKSIETHRRPIVTQWLAALAVVDLAPARALQHAAWLAEADHPALLALRRRLRRDGDPANFAAAWVWLGVPALAAAAAERLITGVNLASTPASAPAPAPAARAEAAALAAVFLRAHRGLIPARRRALEAAAGKDRPRIAALFPGAQSLAAAPPAARQGFARLLAHWPATLRDTDAALGALLADADPTVRLAAVRAAIARGGRPACLLDLAFDAHPRIARSAALAVLAQPERTLVRDPVRERVVAALARARDRRLAALARAATPASTPGGRPFGPADRLALALQRGPALGELRDLLAPSAARAQPHRAEHAVRVFRETGQVAAHAGALARLLTDLVADPAPPATRLAATLAAALGDSPDPRGFEALAASLGAADPRVRANALEAMVRRARRLPPGSPLTPTIEHLADRRGDDPHRLRANAARGLLLLGGNLESDAGARLLLGLLRDPRPQPQAAGLWLTERFATRLAHWPDLVDAVAAAARASVAPPRDPAQASDPLDPDRARVALRAERTARRLIVELREDWSRRATGVDHADTNRELAA